MPIPFLVVGLSIIYLCFYGDNEKYKHLYIVLLSIISLGFFVKDIEIRGVIIDIFIIIPCLIFCVLFSYKIFAKNWIYISVMLAISIITYCILIYINIEFSTLLNPNIIFIATTIMGSMILNEVNGCFVYYILSYLIYDIINIFYIKSSIGVVSIFTASTFSMLIYSVIISFLLNKVVNCIKIYVNKEKTNG